MKILLCIFALVATAMSESSLEGVLKAANDQFTANMFQEVVKAQGDKSCVLSAFSVLSPLAQLALASKGESHDEILRAIGLPNDNVTMAVFSDVNARLRTVKDVELKQANKIYVKENVALNDEFAEISKNVFNSEVQNVDFTQSQAAASEINKWVEDHTNHRIKDLVDPNSLDATTAAVLVNAIYFKGKWKKPFDVRSTRNRDFYVSKEKIVSIPMMYKSDDFKYGESSDLDAKLLEMTYEGDETSLVVVLPNQIDGINSLIEKIKNPSVLNTALDNMYTTEVQVTLPKFKIETTTDLKVILPKMHVTKLFGSEAGLEKLLKVPDQLQVDSATQKAFIEVSEEGVEAAAANQFGAVALSASYPPPIIRMFNANHPFTFFLMKKSIVLFNGVFRD